MLTFFHLSVQILQVIFIIEVSGVKKYPDLGDDQQSILTLAFLEGIPEDRSPRLRRVKLLHFTVELHSLLFVNVPLIVLHY